MSFLTALTTWLRSRPNLSCPGPLWEQLLARLCERGYHGKRESGAFLLGRRANDTAEVVEFVLYDDLDPHSLDRGIVHFDGRYYGALWERCRQTELTVVADVHTHPVGSRQSPSDRAHPMVAMVGHIALIIPRFAMGVITLEEIGIYRYLGARRWWTVPVRKRSKFLQIHTTGTGT